MNSISRTGFRRLTLVVGLAAALAVGSSAAVSANEDSPSQDNSAVAVNRTNNSTVVRTSFRLVFIQGQNVTASNLAWADASCVNCQATAVALEGVVIEGPVSLIKPVNLAAAINEVCSGCHSAAYAGQENITYRGPVELTEAGQERIEWIRQQVRALQRPGLTQAYILTRADYLFGQLQTVLRTQLVPTEGGDDQPVEQGHASMRAA